MKFESIKEVLFLVLMAGVASLSGCNTLDDARMARGTGDFKVYNASAEQIWNALPNVIKSFGLEYVEENRQEGYVLAQRGISAFSYGEEVAIFINPLNEQKTRVEIVSKKVMSTNIFAPNWAPKLFSSLDVFFSPAAELSK